MSSLEAGKHPRAEVQKVLDVAAALDMTVALFPTPAASSDRAAEDDPFTDLFGGRP